MMWQEIEEERDGTSFIQMKRGTHRYPGTQAPRYAHDTALGRLRFLRRIRCVTEENPPPARSCPRAPAPPARSRPCQRLSPYRRWQLGRRGSGRSRRRHHQRRRRFLLGRRRLLLLGSSRRFLLGRRRRVLLGSRCLLLLGSRRLLQDSLPDSEIPGKIS